MSHNKNRIKIHQAEFGELIQIIPSKPFRCTLPKPYGFCHSYSSLLLFTDERPSVYFFYFSEWPQSLHTYCALLGIP